MAKCKFKEVLGNGKIKKNGDSIVEVNSEMLPLIFMR